LRSCGLTFWPRPTAKNHDPARRRRTTIARRRDVSTAPKLWRLATTCVSKIVPREIEMELELPDDDHGVDEWKKQLVEAILCGMFGGTGGPAFLLNAQFRIFGSFAAFLPAVFIGEEVWERLQKRAMTCIS